MFTGFVSTAHQCVGRQRGIENLTRAFDAYYGQLGGVEQSDLNQHGCLVPVNVLMSQLAVSESNNCDQRNLDTFSRRRNPWQHPIHRDRVTELEHHLVDYLIL